MIRCKPQNVAQAIALLSAADQPQVELFRAVLHGQCALGTISSRHAEFAESDQANAVPMVLLLGDDDGLASGPDGWRCANAALAWASYVVVHGAAGERAHYRTAVELAKVFGNVLLIETSSACAEAWVGAIPVTTPRLLIWPRGGAHPIAQPQDMH